MQNLDFLQFLEASVQFSVFHNSSLWLIGVSLFIFLLLSEELGYRVGLRRRKKMGDTDAEIGGGGVVITSMLAVLALILAFTYSSAVSRYEARKQALILEANALSTAYLRTDVLPESARSELKNILYQYALTRIPTTPEELAHRILSPVERLQAMERTLRAQGEIWPAIRRLVLASSPGPGEVSLMSAINELLDIHTVRAAALIDTLPAIVIWMLLGIAAFSLGVTGFIAGIHGRMSRWRMTIFALVLAGVMLVVLDYDRPVDGMIRTNRVILVAVIHDIEVDLDLRAGPNDAGRQNE